MGAGVLCGMCFWDSNGAFPIAYNGTIIEAEQLRSSTNSNVRLELDHSFPENTRVVQVAAVMQQLLVA